MPIPALKDLASRLGGERWRPTWRAALLLLLLLVGWLALTPVPPALLATPWDKLNHGAAFAALAVTSHLGFPGSRARLLWLGLALLAFGGAIELLQSFVPGRSAEWNDLLADATGIGAGMLMGRGLLRAAARASAAVR